jgi:hypothetical protein
VVSALACRSREGRLASDAAIRAYRAIKVDVENSIFQLVAFTRDVNPDFFKGTAVERGAAETLTRPAGVAVGR